MRYEERISEWKVAYRWHRWFAWHPVRLAGGGWRWLVHVERRAVQDDMALFVGAYNAVCTWQYRAQEQAA